MLLGNAFGPYYYVVLLLEFVAASWFLSRLPPWVVVALGLLAIGFTAYSDVMGFIWSSVFWMYRSPHPWTTWFMMEWLAAMF